MAVRVVMVGGGIAGCSTAVELARRGAHVTLLDRDQPGTGATGASAGMLAPQYEAGAPGPLLRFGLQSKELWPEFARYVESLADWPLGYRADGMLVANQTPAEAEAARQDLVWQHQAGLPGAFLTPGEARLIHPGVRESVPSYLWLPAEQQVDSQRLAVALADAVRGAGGRVLAGKEVTALTASDHRADGVLLADGTRISADAVVLAAGAWSGGIGELPRALPVRPVRGQMLRLLPASPAPWPLLADHQGRYLVPRENGTLLVGATMEEVGFDDGVTDHGRALLSQVAMELFPALEKAAVAERWAGLRPMTPDGWPILGPDPEMAGLFYATGYGRNGILFAPLAARALAELITAGRSEVAWEPFGVGRFGEGG